jgi:hypothetical protein
MELRMISESEQVAITRGHMAWAYRFTLFWLILSLAIFGTGYAIAEMGEAAQGTRAAMFIMLGTIIITSAIWQAVALALARFENLILPRLRD